MVAAAFLTADWIGYAVDWHRPERLALAGWFLEMAGIATIVAGVLRLEQALRPNPPPDSIRGWWSRLPLIKRHYVLEAKGVAHSVIAGKAYVTVNRKLGTTVEERVAVLERWLRDVDTRLDQFQRSADKKIDELKDGLKTETAERTAATEALGKRIDETLDNLLGGGISLEIIGVIWILLGVTAATIPEVLYYVTRPFYAMVQITP